MPELDVAFIAEFGFGLENLFQLLGELRDFSLHTKASAGQISETDLRAILEHCNFQAKGVESFFDRFVLPTRSAWDTDLPARCRPSDAFPWHFRRQLSLLTQAGGGNRNLTSHFFHFSSAA